MEKDRQGYYRYNPIGLANGGPARLFPYMGEDGLLRYIWQQLGHNLWAQGKVSPPLGLILQRLETLTNSLEETRVQLGTFLADLEIFQSDWFNFDLPPQEQFNSEFVQHRKAMVQKLLGARQTAQKYLDKPDYSYRNKFYAQVSKQPLVITIHNREGGLCNREFARQRLGGPNPMRLRAFGEQDRAKLPSWLTAISTQTVDLSQAAAGGRLLVLDYPLLANLTTANLQMGRYVGSPQALFYRSEEGLEPLLIQPEAGRKTFTPQDGDAWMRAKLFVQVADVTYQELVDHLCHTHLAMEVFAIATSRQLPHTHPLYQLLKPHFRFLLAINTRGNVILLGKGAAIDKLMALTRETCLSVIDQAYRNRAFEDYSLPKNIHRRGLGKEVLPDFPYRDDGLLLWDAIAKYTTAYLQLYYRDNQQVQQDPYLQAWAAELGAPLDSRPQTEFAQPPWWLPQQLAQQTGLNLDSMPNHPRVPGFGTIDSLEKLIETVTQIIFTCSAQHAAVNFNQFDYLSYAPNSPFAAYARPNEATSIADILPPPEQDLGQMELTYALSDIRWGKLGSSQLIKFARPQERAILQEFQADLRAIETEIDQRNHQRRVRDGVDYPYLLPSRVPNSINI